MHLNASRPAPSHLPASIAGLPGAATQVGTLPPAPPTLRGAAGRLAARVVNRLLAWYTGQIRSFQEESSRVQFAQFQQLRRLADMVNRHERLLNPCAPEFIENWDDIPPLPSPQPAGAASSILDQIVDRYPSDQSAIDIFQDEWLSMMPTSRPDLRAGATPLFEDHKVHWAIAQLGGVAGHRVLELGPLEGGHSYILQNAGAASVLSIESNTRAFLKCLIVKNLLHLDRVDFRCGNFISYLKNSPEQFDTVVACGVLYHMTNPVELLQLLSGVTRRLFVWTHYYDETVISAHPGVVHRMREHWHARHAGFEHTLHRYDYTDSLTLTFAGGLKPYSCWMEREDILACLRHFGFTDIRVEFEQRDHPHGPCFAFLALR